jgi:hypothetical protein
MTAAVTFFSRFDHFSHDAAATMAAVVVTVVLLAYWILRT